MKKSAIDLKFEKMDRKTANSMIGTGYRRKSSTRKVKRVKKK